MGARQWSRSSRSGVKKDISRASPGSDPADAELRPEKLLDAIGATADRAAAVLRRHSRAHLDAGDIALKLAGAGGDGAQTAAMLIAARAINEGFDATHIPSYGPESRGGTSYADVHVAADEVLSPASPHPHILVAFNAPSLAKFGPSVAPAERSSTTAR